ncbi:hypothetical protein BJ875DRAFT_63426 [Amylocarpus encephaloides]|uniref:Uncharacterized protein n=1 Tax=Amylocarpus encephaloides TaxID=45428 RepID=A0A9P8C9C1_9HELO|nr:hypothetical protein BJ875DRAFT_63426 [Amylocarpus encephaloides]
MDDLHSHPKCSPLMHDLLDLTMKQLLVIERSDRTRVTIVHRHLEEMTERAARDEAYMTQSAPRKPAKGSHSAPTNLERPISGGKQIKSSDSRLNQISRNQDLYGTVRSSRTHLKKPRSDPFLMPSVFR